MKRSRKPLKKLWLGLLVVLLGCRNIVPTPIGEILRHPRDYEGAKVVIAGTVTARSSILIARCFTLKDDSGEVRVMTRRALPALGERLHVHGHANEAFAFGSESLVVFEEDDPAQDEAAR